MDSDSIFTSKLCLSVREPVFVSYNSALNHVSDDVHLALTYRVRRATAAQQPDIRACVLPVVERLANS
jgi:hypothetical protein